MSAVGIGELAALNTAVTWAVSGRLNGDIGRTVGTTSIVLLRLPVQLCFMAIYASALGMSVTFAPEALLPLAAAAIFGVVFTDTCLYKSMSIVGTGLAILLMSLSAGLTALLSVIFLGEALTVSIVVGILIATFGVALVVTASFGASVLPGGLPISRRAVWIGVALGLAAAVSQAVSLVFLKEAMNNGAQPMWSGVVRMLLGGGILWFIGFFRGWSAEAVRSIRADARLFRLLLISCALGSFGVWTSGAAIMLTPAGIAATIMALQPVWVVIFSAVWDRKMPAARVVFGTLTAFVGTAVVCLR